MSGDGALRVAIVGGGASGTLVAAQLLRHAQGPAKITLLERGAALGRGLAYGTDWPGHLLNVPARNMSALPGEPDHFLRWLTAPGADGLPRLPGAGPMTFAPRTLYASYLADVHEQARRAARDGVRFEIVRADVRDLWRERGEAVLALGDGSRIASDRVVLALGHSAPSDAVLPDPAFAGSPRYVRDPWRPRALDRVPRDEAVLVLGTALTMVDVVLQLVDQGHAAPIVAISRHGRLPRSHEPAETVPVALAPSVTAADAGSVLDLLRAVRAAARGVDARVAVDALRPATAALWGALLEAERRRFLRHLRPLWDVLRHRLAPQAGSALGDLVASGRLTVRAARLTHLAEVAGGVRVRLQPRGTGPVETLTVGRVVNATGPEPDPVRSADPLLTALRVRGHVRRDPLGLGIVTAPDGAVVGQGGSPSEWLFTIGPLRRGELWESVAIPELRDQAERLAARLLSNRIVTGL